MVRHVLDDDADYLGPYSSKRAAERDAARDDAQRDAETERVKRIVEMEQIAAKKRARDSQA